MDVRIPKNNSISLRTCWTTGAWNSSAFQWSRIELCFGMNQIVYSLPSLGFSAPHRTLLGRAMSCLGWTVMSLENYIINLSSAALARYNRFLLASLFTCSGFRERVRWQQLFSFFMPNASVIYQLKTLAIALICCLAAFVMLRDNRSWKIVEKADSTRWFHPTVLHQFCC